jgi:hypothetical protein
MKKIVRLTESDLHHIVKESVKRVLNESMNDIKTALGEEYNVNPNMIEQTPDTNVFIVPIDGSEHFVYVFNNEEEACNYLWKNWDLEDYCEGAAPIDYWKRGCPECFDENDNPDWHRVAQAVLNAEGPAWFLDGYNGTGAELSNNMIAYRYD